MDDCLVVGGGVIGLSLAYELSGRALQVHVVDQGLVGREASWAGAGILPPARVRPDIGPWDWLRARSHELYPDWSQALLDATGIDNGYRRCGGIYLARSRGEAAALAGLAAHFHQHQIAFQRLDPPQLAACEPALAPLMAAGELKAVYFAADEAQLRNPRHLRALATACRQRGVRFSEGVQVRGVRRNSDRLVAVDTDAGPLTAANFAITGGAWTARLLRMLKIPSGILPIRGQMVLFRCPVRPLRRIINEGARYLVARDDGLVLAGSSEEQAGFDKSTTPDVLNDLEQMARDLVPALRQAPIQQSWAGLRPGSIDGMPYIGRIGSLENAFVAAGHFRSGLHLAPATALVTSDLICRQPTEIDLTPFWPTRG
ncbi:MAG: glycine oxidase ThiO [Planctomycetaceae bacterium]|nr:MAG: glycine oxidase ThiO [Planctomycetaceae bacterium]